MEADHSKSRFNSLADQMLYRLTIDGWANESSGSVEAPTGFFSRISISLDELPEIVEAFEEPMDGAGFVEHEALVGHYLMIEDGAGFVQVTPYDSERELKRDYKALDVAYGVWLGDAS